MAKKRGGQPKPASEQKSTYYQIRLQESEKAAFEQAASLSGLAMSAWMRMWLRKAATEDLGAHGITPGFLPKSGSGEGGNRTRSARTDP